MIKSFGGILKMMKKLSRIKNLKKQNEPESKLLERISTRKVRKIEMVEKEVTGKSK